MIQRTAQAVRPDRRTAYLRIDHLYMVLALVTFGVFTSLVPLPPLDFWWHLRVGQLIAQTGSVPRTNLFAWSLPATSPFVYGAWLGEWLFYIIYRGGGLQLVVFTRTLLALASFGIVGLIAQRRSGSWRLASLAVGLAEAMTLNNLPVRTQNWSWLIFALFLLILTQYARGAWGRRSLWALPPLMIIWANTHGAFILGLVLVALFTTGETLRTLSRGAGRLPWQKVAQLPLIGVITALATLITPQGTGIFRYVAKLVTDPSIQQLVSEWQSPTPHGLANQTFFISILLLLVALATARQRPTPTDLLLVCAFTWLAWTGMRNVVWYGMVVMPVLAQALSVPQPVTAMSRRQRSASAVNSLLCGLMLLPLIWVQPWFVRNVPLGRGYNAQVLPPPSPPLMSTQTPAPDVMQYLHQHPGSKLFNEMGYGSYLIWALPETAVFIDPRIELYPLAQWEDYLHISKGEHAVELLSKYGANRVLLSRAGQPNLSQALGVAADWKREYQNNASELWQKQP
ncbi:MAG: hypothetical protein H0X37_05340 [Herpetosiphonaceae bacterium]|nr:hypothetical protein [Herpetosiphonaceae bacterium]